VEAGESDAANCSRNLALLQNFLGGVDEEWLILVNVENRSLGGYGMQSLANAQTSSE